MNKSFLMGRPTADPQITYTQGEEESKPIAKFRLAVNRIYKRGDKTADFFNCVVFQGRLVKLVEDYVKKGSRILITGQLQNNDYEVPGMKVYGYNFIVETIELLDKKKSGTEQVTEDENGFMQVPDEMVQEMEEVFGK